jgi:hypothetical protein
MTMFEYKVIPAPRKAQRTKGARGTTERFAVGLQGLMNEMGADGWSYVRAETLPVDERHGVLRKAVEEFHTVLIFTRPLTARPVAESSSEPRRPHFFAETAPAKGSGPALGAATGSDADDTGGKATPEIRAQKEPAGETGAKPAKKPAAEAGK